jgi:hypothetical protein
MVTSQGIPAIPADSFVESIGVNTHWPDKVYVHNYTALKAKLAESGIRYVRDSARPLTYDRANDLYNSLGIKTNMVTGRRSGPEPAPLDPTQIDEELNEIKTQALVATVSLESPNEYDLEHGSDAEWVARIKNYSTLLYTKAKADEMLRHLPVIGPSLTSLEAYEAVGNADDYIDYVNLHMYQWSYSPGFSGWDNNGSHSITWYLNELAHQQSPSGKPVQSTEGGYHNDIQTGGLSEEAEGKYTARMFAELFRRGVYRTCKYELTNQDIPTREGVFGLLRIDLSEKPSFRAVKNLITILSDKGPSFESGKLNYALNGSMDKVRQILFQKRNGDFYLMVWVEVSSWNTTALFDLYPPAQEVVLTLQDSSRISSATLYAFNNSADVNTFNLTINNNQVTFNATDKISIIKLSNSTTSISHGLYRLTPKSAFHACLGFNQQWIIEPVGDGFYRLVNRATGQVVGVDGCNANNGGAVPSYDWLKSDCHKWKFDLLPNGYYRITSKHAQDQCLDIQLCSPSDNTKVHQWPWLNTDCQHWKLDWISSAV